MINLYHTRKVWLAKCCLQEGIQKISHSELTDFEEIGRGGYGNVYRAKHPRFGTVAYKELNDRKLGDRYSKPALVQSYCITEQFNQY